MTRVLLPFGKTSAFQCFYVEAAPAPWPVSQKSEKVALCHLHPSHWPYGIHSRFFFLVV